MMSVRVPLAPVPVRAVRCFSASAGPRDDSVAEMPVFRRQQPRSEGSNEHTYRPPTPPVGVPLTKILSNTFPLSYRDSFNQWLGRAKLQQAQAGVLSLLPFYPHPDSHRRASSLQVPVGGDNFINEFEISKLDGTCTEEVAILHGYGAGLGFFYKMFDEVSALDGVRLHALDLLGYGLSSRPKFRVKSKEPLEAILETEDFFTDSLEAWRKQRGIESFTLIAHSLGAYLGASYAIKYPGRLKKLMLVSPAGVPRSSYSLPSEAQLAEQAKKAEQAEKALKSALRDNNGGKLSKIFNRQAQSAASRGNVPLWFHFLWECHVSPFSLVRNTGPLGPRFVSGWTSRRFARLPPEDQKALHLYSYAIFNARGSGEYALNYLLAPGAQGRRPLAERAHLIPCDTSWVYGTEDWMDENGGHQACDNIRANTDHHCELITINGAGHHIYLDNPEDLNKAVKSFITR
uniref:ARAD1A03960p n=1 Tax=Blastobotrys adeninivorans TaxID=409370 RepID=A0A060SWE7_BLAAD